MIALERTTGNTDLLTNGTSTDLVRQDCDCPSVDEYICIGATPTHTFEIPFLASDIDTVIVTYKQGGIIVLEKTVHEFSPIEPEEGEEESSCTFMYTLEQEETLKFRVGKCGIQVNVLKNNEIRDVSEIQYVECLDNYHKQVMRKFE